MEKSEEPVREHKAHIETYKHEVDKTLDIK